MGAASEKPRILHSLRQTGATLKLTDERNMPVLARQMGFRLVMWERRFSKINTELLVWKFAGTKRRRVGEQDQSAATADGARRGKGLGHRKQSEVLHGLCGGLWLVRVVLTDADDALVKFCVGCTWCFIVKMAMVKVIRTKFT